MTDSWYHNCKSGAWVYMSAPMCDYCKKPAPGYVLCKCKGKRCEACDYEGVIKNDDEES